jgi:hypothetical protein
MVKGNQKTRSRTHAGKRPNFSLPFFHLKPSETTHKLADQTHLITLNDLSERGRAGKRLPLAAPMIASRSKRLTAIARLLSGWTAFPDTKAIVQTAPSAQSLEPPLRHKNNNSDKSSSSLWLLETLPVSLCLSLCLCVPYVCPSR